MSHAIYVGEFNRASSDFGLGPGETSTPPIWTGTVYVPQKSTFVTDVIQACSQGILLCCNFAGARGTWTNPDPNTPGNLLFDVAKYNANVKSWTVAGGASQEVADSVKQALSQRYAIAFTVDEPDLSVFSGTISKSEMNDMGLLHKSFWPGCITAQRSSSAHLIPPPASGWTGLDYGWSQYEGPLHPPSNVPAGNIRTAAKFYADEKVAFDSINMGMIGGFNWPNGGDGRNWDYLNTGSSSGRVTGLQGGPTRWLASPQEIKDCADAIATNPALWPFIPAFLEWSNAYGGLPNNATWLAYELRSDFVAAFRYLITTLSAKSFTAWGTSKGSGVATLQYVAPAPVVTRVSTTSGAYVDVAGAVIDNANLTAGKQYWIRFTGDFDFSDTTKNGFVRVVHGSTQFPRSVMSWNPASSSGRQVYDFWTIWTAVAGEDVKLQYKTENGIATIGANFCVPFALNMSDNLTQGVDWVYSENLSSTSLTVANANSASASITPQVPGQDWLVLTSAHYLNPDITFEIVTQQNRSGEAVETDPSVQEEGRRLTDQIILNTAKAVTLNTQNTFKEGSRALGGTSSTRDGSAVLLLNMGQFTDHAFVYDNSELDYLGTASFDTTLGTLPFTATAAGDWYIMGDVGFAPLIAGSSSNLRLRVDGADSPAGQTAAAYALTPSRDATDVSPLIIQSIPNVSAGAHTALLQGSIGTGSQQAGRGASGRCLIGFSLSFAGPVGGTVVVQRKHTHRLGTRVGTRKAL